MARIDKRIPFREFSAAHGLTLLELDELRRLGIVATYNDYRAKASNKLKLKYVPSFESFSTVSYFGVRRGQAKAFRDFLKVGRFEFDAARRLGA